MPTLVLLRHAKSDWPTNVSDLERPLSPRGVRDCGAVASFFEHAKMRFDGAVVSPAQRTQSTFALVEDALSYNIPHIAEPRIYEAHVSELLDVVRGLAGEVVLLVGHGPGVPRLALTLCSNPDSSAAMEIRHKYPTSGIAILHSDKPWSEWDIETCVLQDFVVPRADSANPDSD